MHLQLQQQVLHVTSEFRTQAMFVPFTFDVYKQGLRISSYNTTHTTCLLLFCFSYQLRGWA